MTGYTPIKDAQGATIGVWYVGYQVDMAALKEVVETIRGWGHDTVQESAGVEESIVFVLPKALRKE